MAEEIRFTTDGAVATIELNRPAKLNTVTPAMGRALLEVVGSINADDSVRAVLLVGAGERAFCAGSDVTALDGYGTNWQLRNRDDYARAIWNLRKPVVAAVHGYAIGGGLELAMSSDIRIATADARFGSGEIKLGWHGGAGNTQLLPRLIGSGNALRYLLTGDMIDGPEAYRLGLVQELVEAAELRERGRALATQIAENAPIAVQLTKHLVRVAESTSLEVGLAYENDLFAYCFTTADSREGQNAFKERRAPQFTGD